MKGPINLYWAIFNFKLYYKVFNLLFFIKNSRVKYTVQRLIRRNFKFVKLQWTYNERYNKLKKKKIFKKPMYKGWRFFFLNKTSFTERRGFFKWRSLKKLQQPIELQQVDILALKRRYGLFKRRYNERRFLMFRARFFLTWWVRRRWNLKALKKKLKKKLKKPRQQRFLFKTKNRYPQYLREIRKIMATHFFNNRNMRRQHKRTRFFTIFRNIHYQKIFMFNYKLIHIMYNLNVCGSFMETIQFIKNHGVYINGQIVQCPNYYCTVGDVIQWPKTITKTIFHQPNLKKKQRYLAFKYLRKIRRRTFSLIRSRVDIYKQSATQYPRWGFKFTEPFRQQPAYLQCDFRFNSCVVLYYPQMLKKLTLDQHPYLSLYLNDLYNWKYTT